MLSAMDEQNQVQDEVLDQGVQDTQPDELDLELDEEQGETSSADDVEALKKRLAETEAKNKQLFARLKKQDTKKAEQPPIIQSQTLTREEAILIAQGHDESDLEVLKKIQAVSGIKTLKEATQDDLFLAHKLRKEQEAKRKKAQLGASGGSRTVEKPVKEMTTEEHKEYWRKKTGQ